jgi:hypothetical protein
MNSSWSSPLSSSNDLPIVSGMRSVEKIPVSLVGRTWISTCHLEGRVVERDVHEERKDLQDVVDPVVLASDVLELEGHDLSDDGCEGMGCVSCVYDDAGTIGTHLRTFQTQQRYRGR